LNTKIKLINKISLQVITDYMI